MLIYVLDRQLNRIGVVTNFSYLLWRTKYHENGECEIIAPATKQNLECLQRGNILFRQDRENNNAMTIYYRKLERNNYGEKIISARGYTLDAWLNRRIIWDTRTFNATPKAIIESLINTECVNPSISQRKINFVSVKNTPNFGQAIEMQTSFENLYSKIETILESNEIGLMNVLDIKTKKATFEVYKGADRTIDQSINTRCILSIKFNNVIESNLEESDDSYKNAALIGGEGEAQARIFQNIATTSDLERFEMFVDASDLRKTIYENGTETTISSVEYNNMLLQRGNEKLKENKESINFECELNPVLSNTQIGVDFFLGDKITVHDDEFGVTMNARVIQVDEVFQNNTKNTYVEVGNPVPTLSDKLKRKVK